MSHAYKNRQTEADERLLAGQPQQLNHCNGFRTKSKCYKFNQPHEMRTQAASVQFDMFPHLTVGGVKKRIEGSSLTTAKRPITPANVTANESPSLGQAGTKGA